MKSYRCVGGPLAGKKVALPDGKYHHEVVKTKSLPMRMDLSAQAFSATSTACYETFVYVVKRFKYAPEGLSSQQRVQQVEYLGPRHTTVEDDIEKRF